MFQQVREAAGIHMSTFKKEGDRAEEAAEAEGVEVPEEADLDLSGWTPLPHQMEAFRRA